MMLQTITATICLHPIRLSAELPHSTLGVSFDVRYCSACAKSREILQEHDIAERLHEQLKNAQDPESDKSELRAARVRYNKAHLAYLQDLEQQAERYRQDHGVAPPAGAIASLPTFDAVPRAARRPPRRNLSVRFDAMDEDHHRPEEQYRHQSQYDRDNKAYQPGRYADHSGEGYINTSGATITPELFEYDSDLSEETSDEEDESEDSSSDRADSVMEAAEDEGGVHLPPGQDWGAEDDADGKVDEEQIVGEDWDSKEWDWNAQGDDDADENNADDDDDDDDDAKDRDDDSDLDKLTDDELMAWQKVVKERLDALKKATGC